MSYGTLKIDTITFTDGGIDKSVSVSGLVQNPSFSGNITATGTISGNIIQGQTISGVTVTGTTAAFTSGTFISLTGTTTQGTTATFASGVFTTQISGATITGNAAAFTTVTGGIATITSGVFASGTAAAPSVSVGATDNGIYSPGTDQVAISTNGTERMRIDSSGRLLVGTSTAYGNGLLQIQGDASDATEAGFIALRRGLSDASIGSDTTLGAVNFAGNSTGIGASISASTDAGTWGSGYRPSRLVFSVTADGASSPTERMRILNNGLHRMLSSIAPTLEVRNTLSGSGDPLFQVAAGVSDMSVGGAVVMRVMGDGDVENATGVYTNPVSDERFKTDIVDVGSQWDDIKNVKLKKFRYKNNPDGELQLGIIAQELEPVCPNLIKRKIAGPEEVAASNGAVQEGEEYLSWKASLLPLKAVKALQEAMERIEQLESELAAVKAKLP